MWGIRFPRLSDSKASLTAALSSRVWTAYCGGMAYGAGGTADSVCRLCAVAAATDAGGGIGRTVVVLAEATRGYTGRAGTADGLPAAGEPELSGRAAALHLVAGSDGGAERVEPARGS